VSKSVLTSLPSFAPTEPITFSAARRMSVESPSDTRWSSLLSVASAMAGPRSMRRYGDLAMGNDRDRAAFGARKSSDFRYVDVRSAGRQTSDFAVVRLLRRGERFQDRRNRDVVPVVIQALSDRLVGLVLHQGLGGFQGGANSVLEIVANRIAGF